MSIDDQLEKLVIDGSGIRLGQALKLTGAAEDGADAKRLLAAGSIIVNGTQEKRRGRQLVDGDIIGFSPAGRRKGKGAAAIVISAG